MVNMNEDKERSRSPKGDTSKKMCPRAARENSKKTEVVTRKPIPAHSGLRFHFDRKKLNLVSHEFNFSSVSKTEKVTRCHHVEKSVEKQNSTENDKTKDSKKIEVLMDTLKISKSEECSSREKSPLRKEMPKSPVVERLTSKKACTRCSRCSRTPKEEKSETKSLKVTKDQDQSLKTTKKEIHFTKPVKETPKTPLSPKPTCKKLTKILVEPEEKVLKPKSILINSENPAFLDNKKTDTSKNCEPPQSPKTPLSPKPTCKKLAKILAEPEEKALKPKSILINSEKPAFLNNEKADVSKNCEPPQSPKPMTSKKQCSKLARLLAEPNEKNLNAKPNLCPSEKSHPRDNEKNAASKNCERTSNVDKPTSGKPHCANEKIEFAWPSSGKMESMTIISETSDAHVEIRSEVLNESGHSAESETVTCLLNGTRHDEHLCDPHLGLESPGGTKESMKLASKIPRKTHGASGVKPDVSFNKEMPQQLIEL